MSTIKISQLPQFGSISSNTSNTLFVGVDTPSSTTFRLSAHTLAQGLYSNEVLNVGVNPVTLPNTVAQFSLGGQSYIQTNLVNNIDGGSADHVITANTGTDTTYFVDLGYANKSFTPGTEYNSLGTAINPLDAYLYVQGSAGLPGGNLIVGTTTTGTELRFIVGGGTASNVVAKMTTTGLKMNGSSYLTFNDGSTQSVAASPASYSLAAFNLANTASSNTVAIQGVDAAQNTLISNIQGVDNYQNTYIQAAFNYANTALQNTASITTAGSLNVTGNLSVIGFSTGGLVTVNAVSYVANTPAFKITGSANNYSQTPSNQGYMLQVTGFANVSSRIVNDAFGANSYPVYVGRQARGTATTPASTVSGDILLRLSGNGWGNSFSQFGQSRIDFVAVENFTDTSKGTQIQLWNTKPGTNTLIQIASFNADTVTFTGSVNPQKGFIYTPLPYPGAQTAITVDFANNSVVRAQTATGLTVSFANYTAGKVVELWITNTAVGNQTFTHGCSALNSTVNSTTYTIPGTSTILAKYISFNGDLANTFVSIIHA